MDRVPPKKWRQSVTFAWECGLLLCGQASGRSQHCSALGLYRRLGHARKEAREWWGSRNISLVTDPPSIWLILETQVKSSRPLESVHSPAVIAFFEVLSLLLRIGLYSSTYHISLELFVYISISLTRPGALGTVTFHLWMQGVSCKD